MNNITFASSISAALAAAVPHEPRTTQEAPLTVEGGLDEPDHHRNAPRPDEACLYGLVGDIARAGATTTEANPYAIALNALAFLGCCLGRGAYLPIGNTYHHPRLFTMHVGRSGRGRKGDAMSLLHRVDMALRKLDPYLAPQVHQGGLSTREGLAFLIHDGYRDGKNEVEPVHDKRLWVIESEFANVLQQTKRDGNTLSAALRDCWDGGAIKPATKSNRISASFPHVSLSASVTPAELLGLMTARELTNGFANRFLTIFAERMKLLAFPQATPQEAVDALAQRVAEVLRFAGADRWVERDQHRMHLSPNAAKAYEALYRRELNHQQFGPLVTGLLERRAPVLLRIAMLLALTDLSFVIEEQHITAAWAWVCYWTDSVRFIFSSGAEEHAQQHVTEAANKIVAFLRQHGRKSRTEISRECFQGRLLKEPLDAALDELLQATPPVIEATLEKRREGVGSGTTYYTLVAKPAQPEKSGVWHQLAGRKQAGDTSEPCEFSLPGAHNAADQPSSVRTIRSLRATTEEAQTVAAPVISLTSQDSHDTGKEPCSGGPAFTEEALP